MATDTRQSGCANALEFDQPHWKVIAAGLDTEKWFTEGQAVGTGGILMPEPTRMPSGNYYYRFASSTSARPAQLGGGWWIDFEAFKTIETFAKTNGYRLKDAARLMLALPYDWDQGGPIDKSALEITTSCIHRHRKTCARRLGRRRQRDKVDTNTTHQDSPALRTRSFCQGPIEAVV